MYALLLVQVVECASEVGHNLAAHEHILAGDVVVPNRLEKGAVSELKHKHKAVVSGTSRLPPLCAQADIVRGLYALTQLEREAALQVGRRFDRHPKPLSSRDDLLEILLVGALVHVHGEHGDYVPGWDRVREYLRRARYVPTSGH